MGINKNNANAMVDMRGLPLVKAITIERVSKNNVGINKNNANAMVDMRGLPLVKAITIERVSKNK